jgi:hypothetical protein
MNSHRRKLVLHIGCHKNGTTSIQKAMANNPQRLAEHGFSLFQTEPNGALARSGNTRRWVKFDRESLIHSRILPGLAERLDECGENVVMSAETLSWLFEPDTIRDFYESVGRYFSPVSVIVYIRRQDRQLVSHYQQSSKNTRAPAWRFYGGQVTAMPKHQPHFRHYLDYNQRLGTWADIFGADEVTIRVFEPDLLYRGDVVSDFFHVLGLACPEKLPRDNVSRGFEETKLGHLMNVVGLSRSVRAIFKGHLDKSQKFLPARADARALYERYRQSNIELNNRFGICDRPSIFSEDFDDYPEGGNELWTEEAANRAIVNILRSAAPLTPPSEKEIDFLVQQALEAESEDTEMARRLLRIAEKFRPDGPAIRKSLGKYQKIDRG